LVLLSLQELQLRPVHFDVEVPAGEIEYAHKVTQSSSLRAKGTAELLSHRLGEIWVKGSLAVTAEAPCDRCLERATIPIVKEFDLFYYPAEEYQAEGEDELEKEASEVAYYEGDRLELNDILREVVLLALPMQLVCSESCKGICPTCGRDRNMEDCHCQTEAVDDRWNKLRTLRTELSHRQ
jgi:uncharacterized protein